MNLLNVGCGARFHPAWTNIDLEPSSPAVTAHDVRFGLPYESESFDACYSSHVLEHIPRADVESLLREMYRVLKHGGIIRCAVPDLEDMARTYLRVLDDLADGRPDAEANHDWMIIEIYDQTVRTEPGGEMSRYLRRAHGRSAEFVLSRIGEWPSTDATADKPPLWSRIRRNGGRGLLRRGRLAAARLAVRVLAGGDAQHAFEEGVFRNSGEIHRWMYDRYSLGRLLEKAGFQDVRNCEASESSIPNFAAYELDSVGGRAIIPQSMFLEAIKN